MLEVEGLCQAISFVSVLREGPTCEILAKISAWRDGCNWLYCGIRKAREDMTQRSPLAVGAWRAQVHQVDQAWGVFCYLCTPTLFSIGSISTWRLTERIFDEFFGFLFDNTSWCYLIVASFFPYSCTLLLSFVAHVYALEQLSVYCASLSLVPHLDKLELKQSNCNFYLGV